MSRIVRLSLFLTLLLPACTPPWLLRDSLEKGVGEYARLLRWKETEKACFNFATKETAGECLHRGREWEGATVADVRATVVNFDKGKKEAEVRMDYDYFVLPSATLRKTNQVEKWRLDEKEGRWVVETPPPLLNK